MIDQINKLIQINLLLFFNAKQKTMVLQDFRNHEGNPLPGAKMLAEIMQQKELIKPKAEEEGHYELTELGRYIAESGGWLHYLEKVKKVKKSAHSESNKAKSKSKNCGKQQNLQNRKKGLIQHPDGNNF